MLHLKPDGRVELEHRADFFLRGNYSRIITTGHGRLLSIVRPDLQSVQTIQLPFKIRSVSLHPSLERFAWIDEASGSLRFRDFNRNESFEAPVPQHQVRSTAWLNQGLADCHFDDDGDYLWLVAQHNGRECEIHLLELRTGAIVDSQVISDPFGGSACSFHSCARPGMMALWLGAGQDGQQVYWLHRTENRISCTLEMQLTNTVPPVFSPGGSRLLVVNDRQQLINFEFPAMRKIAAPLSLDEEDDCFSEYVCYLNARQALVGTNEQRIFVVDTAEMKIEQEVAVESHEPRPIGHNYSALSKETGLGTDISHFYRIGDVIVFVFGRVKVGNVSDWKESLSWLRARG